MQNNITIPDDVLEAMLQHRVLMMCGISGSGKTTVARLLQAHGYSLLSTDHIVWERYGRDYDDFDAARRAEIFMQSNVELRQRLADMLEQGGRVVIDAPLCKCAGRDALRALCGRYGASCLIVYLPADYDTLARRLARRSGNGPDDRIVPTDDLRRFTLNFEPPTADEPTLTLLPADIGSADCSDNFRSM